MKLKKMSLKEISGVLSREEMKKIMAGSGWTNVYCGFSQVSDYFCKQYDSCWTCEMGSCYDWCNHASPQP